MKSNEEIGIEDRLAILEDKLPSLHHLDDFHCTDKFNQSALQFRFDEYAWETRIVWHYCQPWHSKAFYQHFKAQELLKNAQKYDGDRRIILQMEANELLDSCIHIYEKLINSTSVKLPEYMYQQHKLCKNDSANLK